MRTQRADIKFILCSCSHRSVSPFFVPFSHSITISFVCINTIIFVLLKLLFCSASWPPPISIFVSLYLLVALSRCVQACRASIVVYVWWKLLMSKQCAQVISFHSDQQFAQFLSFTLFHNFVPDLMLALLPLCYCYYCWYWWCRRCAAIEPIATICS